MNLNNGYSSAVLKPNQHVKGFPSPPLICRLPGSCEVLVVWPLPLFFSRPYESVCLLAFIVPWVNAVAKGENEEVADTENEDQLLIF